MGTRQLSRLAGKGLPLGDTQSIPDEDSGSNEDESSPRQAKKFNPFAFLGDKEADSDGDENPDETEQEDADSKQTVQAEISPKPTSKKASKSKRKAKKGSKGAVSSALAAEDTLDIDKALRELGDMGMSEDTANTNACAPKSSSMSAINSILSVQRNQLDPTSELRSVFGREVVALEQAERRQQQQQYRNRPQNRDRGRQAQRSWLLCEQGDLPPAGGLLSMDSLGVDANSRHQFQFSATATYRSATALFQQAQATMSPNNVAAVLSKCPFHIESLLALHDIYTATGQADYAEPLLNRALYALESAWHVHFKAHMLAGTASMPHDLGLNSLMFDALYRRIQHLNRQGMHRTALEWAKLTLALDHRDNCGMLFCMDYLALRARQYTFVQSLLDSFEGPVVVSSLPNVVFSGALASYYLEKLSSSAPRQTATGVHEPGTCLHLDKKLFCAICSFPTAFVELVKQLQDQGAATSAAWKSVMAKRIFASPVGQGSATLAHLSRIFAISHVEMWKPPDILAWLLRCAEAAIDAAALQQGTGGAAADEEEDSGPCVADLQALTSLTYPDSTHNAYSHINLAQLVPGSRGVALPPEHLQDEGGIPDGGVSAEDIVNQLLATNRPDELTDEDLQSTNPFVALLQTMLPWVRVSSNDQAEVQAQLSQQLLSQIPGLAEHLQAHGIDPQTPLSSVDRDSLVAIIQEFLQD